MMKYLFFALLAVSASAICNKEQRHALPKCEAGKVPDLSAVFTGGCPSCVPQMPKLTCTMDKLKACKDSYKSLPECTAGALPEKEDCCISCRPVMPKCDAAARTACKESYKSLPDCEAPGKDSKSYFDAEKCCTTCKLPSLKTGTGACSPGDFKACITADTTPECAAGQEPEKVDGQCCPTCRRASRFTDLKDIAECWKNLEECPAGEKPGPVKTGGLFTCLTCKPARPTCAADCTGVCARSKHNDSAGKCRKQKLMKFIFKAKAAVKEELKEFMKNIDEEKIRGSLIEMIERFCENAANSEECTAHKTALIDGLIVKIKNLAEAKAGTADPEVDITVPDVATARRRLLADSSPSTLLTSATASESGDFQVEPESNGSSAPTDSADSPSSSAVALSLGITVVVPMAALLLL